MSFILVENNIGIPKYRQIVSSIENAISAKQLKKGDKLPSINSIKYRFSLSRDTVLTAYKTLKSRGIIEAIPGKGYYIKSENLIIQQKIFMLFDELNSFKEDLYNAFLDHLGTNIQVDIFFHHFNFDVFSRLIADNNGRYNHYVIMPANLVNAVEVIQKLPKEKVYILDQTHDNLKHYPAIYQNFEKALFNNLMLTLPEILKYKELILHFPMNNQPQGIYEGFVGFVKKTGMKHRVIDKLNNENPMKGNLYLILDDRSLITLLRKIKDEKFTLGKDIGVISYNDTLLKEIVEGGITTISTDFKHMGKRLAKMILNNETVRIENPNALIIRNSL